jgi:hypothetical protein
MCYAPNNILIGLQTLILDLAVAVSWPSISNQKSDNTTEVNAVALTKRKKWFLRLQGKHALFCYDTSHGYPCTSVTRNVILAGTMTGLLLPRSVLHIPRHKDSQNP